MPAIPPRVRCQYTVPPTEKSGSCSRLRRLAKQAVGAAWSIVIGSAAGVLAVLVSRLL